MDIGSWINSNWDKAAAVVLSVIGAVWAAARRASKVIGRMDDLTEEVEALKGQVGEMDRKNKELESTIMRGFDKVESRFGELLDLRVFVERQDVLLKTIHDDLKDIKEDVKTLMRDG